MECTTRKKGGLSSGEEMKSKQLTRVWEEVGSSSSSSSSSRSSSSSEKRGKEEGGGGGSGLLTEKRKAEFCRQGEVREGGVLCV